MYATLLALRGPLPQVDAHGRIELVKRPTGIANDGCAYGNQTKTAVCSLQTTLISGPMKLTCTGAVAATVLAASIMLTACAAAAGSPNSSLTAKGALASATRSASDPLMSPEQQAPREAAIAGNP